MRKRRIAAVAAAIGAAFSVVVFLWPSLSHVRWLGWLYAPALLVTILLSDMHAPSAVVAWTAMIVESGFITCVVIVVAAVSQERAHFRAVAKDIDEAAKHLSRNKDGTTRREEKDEALVAVGRALLEVNRRRKRSWFLEPLPTVGGSLNARRSQSGGNATNIVGRMLSGVASLLSPGTASSGRVFAKAGVATMVGVTPSQLSWDSGSRVKPTDEPSETPDPMSAAKMLKDHADHGVVKRMLADLQRQLARSVDARTAAVLVADLKNPKDDPVPAPLPG